MALKELSPNLPKKGSKILIKQNLFEPRLSDSGAVTRLEVIEAVIQFLGDNRYEICVGEGAAILDTSRCFEKANYLYLVDEYNIKLVDLNQGEFVKVKVNGNYWQEFEIARIVKEADYLISAAVLKHHPFRVTLTLKNMMGVLKPGARYPVKSYIHREDNHEIWADRMVDLVSEVTPGLAVIDVTTGMFGSHLPGKQSLIVTGRYLWRCCCILHNAQ